MTNICGVLLKVRPDAVDFVSGVIADIAGTDLHATTGDGRMVVTVEDMPDMPAHDRIMALHQLPGVLSFTLSYHHFEPLDDAPARTAIPA